MASREWTDDEVLSEIKEAVAIVREDRFEKFARERLAKGTPDPTIPDPKAPPSGGANPDPNAGTPKKSKSLFWGEVD